MQTEHFAKTERIHTLTYTHTHVYLRVGTPSWNTHSVDLLYLERFCENFVTGVPTNASGSFAAGTGCAGGSVALGLELKGKCNWWWYQFLKAIYCICKKPRQSFLQVTFPPKHWHNWHGFLPLSLSKYVAQDEMLLKGCLPVILWETGFLLISYPHFSNFGQHVTDESCSCMHTSCIRLSCYCW